MDLTRCKQILVFGGSFDPPHRAHVALPEQVRLALQADAIAYIPAARAPHKLDREQTAAEHRLAMLRLAVSDRPHAVVLMEELQRASDGKPSYTVDTLEVLRRQLPASVRLRLLIGADQLHIFDKWRNAARVVELAEPVVMVRPPESKAALLESLGDAARQQWAPRLVTVGQMPVSSTMVRDRVRLGQSIDDLVPEAVARYIAEHGLYRDGG